MWDKQPMNQTIHLSVDFIIANQGHQVEFFIRYKEKDNVFEKIPS